MKKNNLRISILQQAIEGKLVPQLAADGNAQDLVDNIREHKAELIREKKLKKDPNESYIYRDDEGHFMERIGKQEPVCIDENLPFAVPEGWTWARLGEIGEKIHYGYTSSALTRGVSKLLRITDVQKDKVNWNNVPFCEINDADLQKFELHNHDILIARTGGTVGKSYLVESIPSKSVFASYLIRIVPFPHVNVQFLKIYMLSSIYWKQLYEGLTGTGQPNINAQTLSSLLLPLPPLAEQARIVAKVEELMPLAEKFEKQSEELAQLNGALPGKLRKSILQHAIKGLLVPQLAADGNAQDLVDNIREHKAELVREKKLKKDPNESYIYRDAEGHFMERIGKKEPVCIDDDLPFAVPEGWTWARLGEICEYNTNTNVNVLDIPDEAWILELEDLETGTAKILNYRKKGNSDINGVRKKFCENDVLFSKLRTYLNKVLVAPKNGYCTTEIVPIKFYGGISSTYMCQVLRSPYSLSYSSGLGYGVKMPRLGTVDACSLLLPLPPLAEQERIVKKVEELMEKVDKMEKAIKY